MPFTKENVESTKEMYNKYMTGRSIQRLTDDLVNFLKQYFDLEPNKNSKAIIGISGGKDSTCLLGLLTRAIGSKNVICVSMPLSSDVNSRQEITEILNHFQIPEENRRTSEITDGALKSITQIPQNWNMNNPEHRNLAARIRMLKLYYLAQIHNARVANTSNQSENIAGWFTKWGDNTGDFFPFLELTASEVVLVGLKLGIPEKWMFKVPDDGMIGTSDEKALGFTYNELDHQIFMIKTDPDSILPRAFEECLPIHMRERYVSGIHKRFSLLIDHGDRGYIPVFCNTPRFEHEVRQNFYYRELK